MSMKMSRKELRERNKARRNFWPMNPVTRVKESGKVYNRKRLKRELDDRSS